MRKVGVLVLAAFCLVPMIAGAQQTNEGATLTAKFTAVPPTIDGILSPGEWNGAGVAGGPWSIHDSATLVDAQYIPVVRVMYGVEGLYVSFECIGNSPEPGNKGQYEWRGGGPLISWVDYCTVYLDPTNGATGHSYGLQAEPSISVLGKVDGVMPNGNSYMYDGIGTYEGLRMRWLTAEDAAADQGLAVDDPTVRFWGGGAQWDQHYSVVKDAMRANNDGFVIEWFISYKDLSVGFWDGYVSVFAEVADVNLGDDQYLRNETNPNIPGTNAMQNPTFAKSAVTGMPAPGSSWEANFGHDFGSLPAGGPRYFNWVGDSGGFATKPFGKIIFGAVDAAAITDAMLHNQ